MDGQAMQNTHIVKILKTFDARTANEMEGMLEEAIKNDARNIICDFSETEFISSAGLRVLLTAMKKLQRRRGRIIICSPGHLVLEVFRLAGLTNILSFYDTCEEAIADIDAS